MQANDSADQTRFRSKPIAGLLALLAGVLGAHRLYLGSSLWWLYPVLALPPLALALQAQEWFRHPAIVVPTVVALVAFGEAIRFSLTPDERWDALRNAGLARRSNNRWAPVFVAIAALVAGTIMMVSVMAISLETLFLARRTVAR
ncbi:MAG: NINE protein [Burkholderiaceae bacterium]|nr:NINE protein [Burkholderiaceae bacterium]